MGWLLPWRAALVRKIRHLLPQESLLNRWLPLCAELVALLAISINWLPRISWWKAANSQRPCKCSSWKPPVLFSGRCRVRQGWTRLLWFAGDRQRGKLLFMQSKQSQRWATRALEREQRNTSLFSCLLPSSSPVVLISSSRWVEK